jgi:hypothetical protein
MKTMTRWHDHGYDIEDRQLLSWLVQGRVKGLGRQLIESFKEEKEEEEDEDHTNASKCVASGNERRREDTGKKDEKEDEALLLLLLLLHWIELVESRTSRGSQRKRRTTTTTTTTATRCGTVPGGGLRVGVAPLLLTRCFFSPLRLLLLRCCHLFICNNPTAIFEFFFSGEFPTRFDLKTSKKFFAQSDQLYYEFVTNFSKVCKWGGTLCLGIAIMPN